MNATRRPLRDRDAINGLVKGLKLIEAFDAAHTRMTLSEAARRVDISPAAARRCLLTLCAIGYAQTDGKRFWLGHGALRIAYAYASSTRLPRLMQPALDSLSERTRESASVAVLHGADVVVAARSTARRSLTVGLGVGSRLPLHCSATGRTLLASLPADACDALLGSSARVKLTPHTVTDPAKLRRLLRACRENGYASSNEEIELGVRSLAVPLYNGAGDTVAALSISSRADRMQLDDMVHEFLPAMLRSQAWARSRIG
jgi:IclR family transcriptional regulator, pca regulon regulatory protein